MNIQATSSATLNSILASPRTHHQSIPAKRKIRDVSPTPPIPAKRTIRDVSPMLSPSPFPYIPISTPTEHTDVSSEAVNCVCGFAIDDGFSIACDLCSRWCHSACFGIAQGGPVPDAFECWVCQPRSPGMKERAVRLQRERLSSGLLGVSNVGALGELGLGLTLGDDTGKQRRRLSPGTDRRARKGHAAPVVDASAPAKRRRRPSVLHPPPTPTISHQPPLPMPAIPQPVDDEHVDIDAEPWTATYVPITHDIIPDDDTRTKLRRHAQHWRGITAVSPCPPSPPPIAIRPLLPSSSPLLSSTNPHCLPPSYAAYTTRSLPSSSLITPFLSCITPSSAYLREPTNGYAHLGMPKPYVHLVGPPLGVALDARGVGGQGRFVRWGCRPNAVLRPVLCKEGREHAQKVGVRYEKQKEKERDADETESEHDPEEDDTTLGFAVFALRDLKAGEEVVLGWEWDDGHAVHRLPALFRAPNMFPRVPPGPNSPAELTHLRNQLSSILHALSSTFTTCACGSRARDCALSAMAAVVERLEGVGAAPVTLPEHDPGWAWADEGRQERSTGWGHVDMGPLVGRKRGFRTRERVPFSGGMGGMEIVEDGEDIVDGQMAREESRKGRGRGALGKRNGTRVNGRRVLAGKYALEAGAEKEKYTFSVVAPSNRDSETAETLYVRQDRKGKGKARAVDGDDEDMDMDDCVGGRSKDPATASLQPDPALTSTARSSPVPTTHMQPNLEPRPPDPPPADPPLQDEDRIPPKMRKRWMHREVKSRSLLETYPPPVADDVQESVVEVFDGRAVDTDRGLAIRFDDHATPTITTSLDEHTQDHLMPPPPMPAALDPTTVSSLHARSTTPTPSPPSPHLPTPSPTQLFLSPGVVEPRIVVHNEGDAALPHHKHPYPYHLQPHHLLAFDAQSTGTSPLTGFANLSLMSPALVRGAEDKDLLVMPAAEVPTSIPSPSSPQPVPSPSSSPSTHQHDRDSGTPEDHDVEMGAADDRQGDGGVDAPEEELSTPWSPLRRADKEKVMEIQVDTQSDLKEDVELEPVQSPATAVQHELSEEQSTPSPLDSMASTPAPSMSPVPVPVLHLQRNASPEESNGDPMPEENQAEDVVIQVVLVEPDAPPLVTSFEAGNDKPLPSPRSISPANTSDAVQIQDIRLPDVVKALPPGHFFDTDNEEEWKRQMDVDESASRSHSPPVQPVFVAQEEEEIPQSSSVVDTIRTPQTVYSESDNEADDERGQPSVLCERQDSVGSSHSASVAMEVDGANGIGMPVDEPPPSTGSTTSTTTCKSEAPPILTESASDEVDLTAEDRQFSTEPFAVIAPSPLVAPETSSSSLTAKSASPSPADSLTSSTAPEHQLPHMPVHESLAHDHTAQPKVKLSLRDFVLRKKKQREEQEATKSTQASPMSVTSALAPDDGDGERGSTPVLTARDTPKHPPGAAVKEDTTDLPSSISSADPGPNTPSAPSPALVSLGVNEENGSHLTSTNDKQDIWTTPLDRSKTAWWLSQVSKHDATELNKAPQESRVNSIHEKPWLPVSTLAGNSKPDAKVHEAVPISVPAEVAVVPPAKLDMQELTLNGHHRLLATVPSPSALPLPPKPPFSLPARPQQISHVHPSHPIDTLEAKTELLDPPVSHLSTLRPPIPKPPPQSNIPSQFATVHRLPTLPDRSTSPPGQAAHSRRPSHEDGEIEASPPLAPYRRLASSARPFPSKGPLAGSIYNPRTPSTPTGPRSLLHLPSASSTPSFNGGGSSYRPPFPSLPVPPATSAAANRPAPPIAPRALRESMLSNKPVGVTPSNPPSTTPYSHGGSQYIPRGPSADRDRDRDRDWDGRHYRTPRRGGGGGWSR